MLVLLSVVAALNSSELAQNRRPPEVGSRLRAVVSFTDSASQAAHLGKLHGALVSWEGNRLLLREEARGETLAVPLAQVARLEVSRGLRSNAGRGALIGLVVGVAVGVPLGLAAYEDTKRAFYGITPSQGQWVLGFGAGGGAVGALVGALIGEWHKTELWKTLPVPDIHVQLAVPGRRDGVQVALRMRY